MTLLKIRVAAWRYDRGTRSLEQNLLNVEPITLDTRKIQNTEIDDDDEIPLLLEDIIQELIEGLNDTDIVVRYYFNYVSTNYILQLILYYLISVDIQLLKE